MGDRAYVLIKEDGKPGVAFYTHWHGSQLPEMVERALQTPRAMNRLDDVDYLARILLEELIDQAGDYGKETGWGICSQLNPSERIVGVSVTPGGVKTTYIGY